MFVCLVFSLIIQLIALHSNSFAQESDRPNIVLLVSEDNSVHFMEHFFPGGAKTPHLETLAEAGITFDRAFSNSPVCSVARTTVITSVYAPRIAAHHHRKMNPVQMPEGWEMFPYYLREAGYYTVKNGKKDFNIIEGDAWDEDGGQAHWRGRPNEHTPFFYMEQTGPMTHEGNLHFEKQVLSSQPTVHNPEKTDVFPYLPDTDLARYTHARFLDLHVDMDKQVGEVISELKKDGLFEHTIIIYYGDHGGVLPRSKGYLYETGLHVPMIVHIPEKYQHLSPFAPGSRVDGFVEFVDLGPTILNLAGAGLPAHMDGKPFLGANVTAGQLSERDEAFGYAGRFDEKYDMVRTLRKGNYKYVRSYYPFYPDALYNRYRYLQPLYQQWRQLYELDELNEIQRQFFEPRTPEALYDLTADPHETRNLADDPAYTEILENMRERLRLRMKNMPDLGLFPESFLIDNAVNDPLSFAERNTHRITQLLDVADLVFFPFEEALPQLRAALKSEDPWQRYWALVSSSVFGSQAGVLAACASELMFDESAPVRIRAAEFFGILHSGDPLSVLYDVVAISDNQADVLLALNTITYVRDHLGYEIDPLKLTPSIESDQIAWRMEYLQKISSD